MSDQLRGHIIIIIICNCRAHIINADPLRCNNEVQMMNQWRRIGNDIDWVKICCCYIMHLRMIKTTKEWIGFTDGRIEIFTEPSIKWDKNLQIITIN